MGRTVGKKCVNQLQYTGDKEVTGNVKLRKDDEGVLLPNQANLLDTTDPTVVLSDKK